MERALYRFLIAGALVGVLLWSDPVRAQTVGSSMPLGQLTAAGMMGQDEPLPLAVAEDGDPTESKPIFSILNGIQARGSINIGYSFNFNDNERGAFSAVPPTTLPETPGRVFDVFHNEFTVHNVILYLEKPVDSENPIGFSFAPTVGKDASGTQDGNIAIGAAGAMDIDILEANIQVYAPESVAVLGGTKFTMGKFITSAGGEVIDAAYNDMFSRSLLFGFAIPFVHTGFKAEKALATRDDGEDLVALSLGIANGWGNHLVGSDPTAAGRSNGNFPTWLNTLSITPSDSFSLTINDFVGETTATGQYRNLLDIVATLRLTDDLTISGNFDWITDQANPGVPADKYSELWGLAGIIRYDFGLITDDKNWYLAFRGEYFRDYDGRALSGLIPATSPARGVDIYDLTWTIGYKPFNNLLLRAEVRYDQADVRIYEGGGSNHQTTLSFDASLLF